MMRWRVFVVLGQFLLALVTGWASIAQAGYHGIERVVASSAPGGVVIELVQPGSPADRAALRPGDHLLSVDGVGGGSGMAFTMALTGRQAGDVSLLEVRRAPGGDVSRVEAVSITVVSLLTASRVLASLVLYGILGGLITLAVGILVLRQPDHPASDRLIRIAGAVGPAVALSPWLLLPMLHGPALATGYRLFHVVVFNVTCAAIFHLFSTLMPRRSRLGGLTPVTGLKGKLMLYVLPVSLGLGIFAVSDSARDWSQMPGLILLVLTVLFFIGTCGMLPDPVNQAQAKQVPWLFLVSVGPTFLHVIPIQFLITYLHPTSAALAGLAVIVWSFCLVTGVRAVRVRFDGASVERGGKG